MTATSINWSSVESSAKSIIQGDCSYPSVLQDLLGDDYYVINCGVGGENTLTIMGCQGASAMKLAHDVTIYPSDRSKYKIHLGNNDIPAFLSSNNDTIVTPLLQNTQHFNPVFINGKEYEITSESNIISYIIDGKHKFDFE